MSPRPHDLIWLNAVNALQGELPEWVSSQWRVALPLVVRRDSHPQGLIAVGVRGLRRDQRAAGWVAPDAIQRTLTPETLADVQRLLRSPFVSQQPVQAAILLAQQSWSWSWGITGSCGYALASEVPVMHGDSDLDLLIRAPQQLAAEELARWSRRVASLPCRADTQVETPYGAFALNEWLRDGRVLLKTNSGPRITSTPWQEAE
ncbi:phosphoribosyl-dephospho-CoA transferase [Erwinia toletana]|uniref:Phosphoribosyl-dephospho-CoA transferase n=1 Tax=Winslowiella toletana TaxID=92490 RepID=A0ABS4P6H0_9GAMM|nr:malonate decarboxylase holo-ACP synthase [Winslowiella toletana]MBP2168242.1 phosphoribosyl-dephospho-CoA transferase [Winslowiella toletana]